MTFLRFIILLQITTMLALGQSTHDSEQSGVTDQPEAIIRGRYQEIVSRHPVGIPKGAHMRAIATYLSKALLHRIDLAEACEADYYRLHQKPQPKTAKSRGLSSDSSRAKTTRPHPAHSRLKESKQRRMALLAWT